MVGRSPATVKPIIFSDPNRLSDSDDQPMDDCVFGITTELSCDARSVTSLPVRRTRYEDRYRVLGNATGRPCVVNWSDMLGRTNFSENRTTPKVSPIDQ